MLDTVMEKAIKLFFPIEGRNSFGEHFSVCSFNLTDQTGELLQLTQTLQDFQTLKNVYLSKMYFVLTSSLNEQYCAEYIDSTLNFSTPLNEIFGDSPDLSQTLQEEVSSSHAPLSADVPGPSNAPFPVGVPGPSHTPLPADVPGSSNTPLPVGVPGPSHALLPADVPGPSNTLLSADVPGPSNAPFPVGVPGPSWKICVCSKNI